MNFLTLFRSQKWALPALAGFLSSIHGVRSAVDVTPPVLVEAIPASGSSGVPTNQAVGFRFSEPMVTQVVHPDVRFIVLDVPPIVLSWNHSWSADKLTLTCRPLSAWPPGSTISWIIGTNLFDPAGNRLAAMVAGNFTTAFSGGTGGEGSGSHPVTTHSLLRMDAYEQDSPNPPVVAADTASRFAATTTLASNRVASAISVTTPAAGSLILSQDPFAPESWAYEETSLDPQTLDERFPGGNHQFMLQTGETSDSTFVFLPLTRPAVPHVSNWDAAQGIRVDQDFVLIWHVWPGATAQDHIRVRVGDGVFDSGAPGQPVALTGLQTNVTIPAGRLAPASRFDVVLTFLVRRSASYPTTRTEALAERGTTTAFTVMTASAAATPLTLTEWTITPGTIGFNMNGPARLPITVANRPSLDTDTPWSAVLITNLGPGILRLSLPLNPSEESGYYRATSP